MRALLLILLLIGGGAYFFYQQKKENEGLKQKVDALQTELQGDFAGPGGKYRMVRKHVVCTQCRGEGAVMVRRTYGTNTSGLELNNHRTQSGVTGTIADVKAMCALCMGTGKRDFDMPSIADLCPDCQGMGKRIVARPGDTKMGVQRGSNSGDMSGGFLNQAPTSSSCPRCLGKGFVLRPGMK